MAEANVDYSQSPAKSQLKSNAPELGGARREQPTQEQLSNAFQAAWENIRVYRETDEHYANFNWVSIPEIRDQIVVAAKQCNLLPPDFKCNEVSITGSTMGSQEVLRVNIATYSEKPIRTYYFRFVRDTNNNTISIFADANEPYSDQDLRLINLTPFDFLRKMIKNVRLKRIQEKYTAKHGQMLPRFLYKLGRVDLKPLNFNRQAEIIGSEPGDVGEFLDDQN